MSDCGICDRECDFDEDGVVCLRCYERRRAAFHERIAALEAKLDATRAERDALRQQANLAHKLLTREQGVNERLRGNITEYREMHHDTTVALENMTAERDALRERLGRAEELLGQSGASCCPHFEMEGDCIKCRIDCCVANYFAEGIAQPAEEHAAATPEPIQIVNTAAIEGLERMLDEDVTLRLAEEAAREVAYERVRAVVDAARFTASMLIASNENHPDYAGIRALRAALAAHDAGEGG